MALCSPGPVLRASHQPWTSVTSHYSGGGRAWNTNQQLPIFLNHTRSSTRIYRITVRKMFSQSYLYVNVNIQQIFSMSQIKSFYVSLYCKNPLFNAKLKIPCLELFIRRTGGEWSPPDRAPQLTTHSAPHPQSSSYPGLWLLGNQAASARGLQHYYSAHPRASDGLSRQVSFTHLILLWCTF